MSQTSLESSDLSVFDFLFVLLADFVSNFACLFGALLELESSSSSSEVADLRFLSGFKGEM